MSSNIACPTCKIIRSDVIDSRGGGVNGSAHRRRRRCKNGHMFTTYETIESPVLRPEEKVEQTIRLICEITGYPSPLQEPDHEG